MFRFEELDIWKLSIQYAKDIYKTTESFPKSELFGLSLQIKRAVLSISSNIAEGSGSSTIKDYCNYLDIAIKSCKETVSQLLFAQEMDYIDEQTTGKLYADA